MSILNIPAEKAPDPYQTAYARSSFTPAIYQPMTGRHQKWWCLPHKREANHICIRPVAKDIRVHCDPQLGGIMLPCQCEKIPHG